MKNKTMPEHDSSYKLLFSHARMVEDLLCGFVHEEWVERLDFSTLEKMSSSYVSDDLRDREDDIVWRVRWGKDWLYVYILLEFQSTVDHWMAVRIMTYLGLLYQDLIRNKLLTSERKLPPVLPLVLYNGRSPWNAALDISNLITKIPGGIGRYRPQMRYLLLAERDFKDEELKPLHNLVAALFRLENGKNPELMLDVVEHLLKWLSGPEQDTLRRAFTVWFRRVLFPTKSELIEQPALEELYEVKNMLAETVQDWKREWKREARKEGKREGKQEGKREGELKGKREGTTSLLLHLLEQKFGPLSADIIAQLNNADEKQLLQWSERLLAADTIGEIFGQ